MINKLPKEKIRAVHDENLETVLEGLGIWSQFKRGELKCKFCKNIITLDNLHSIFPQSGAIKMVCENHDCVRELLELLRKGEISL